MMTCSIRLLACSLVLTSVAASAAAGPTPQRAAQCVAALKLRADALVAQLDPKKPHTELELVRVLEHGYAFVGDAYLNGLRDSEKAEALLEAAEKAQVGVPPAQMAQRQAACQVEAQAILDEVGSIGRMIVSHKAKKRLVRLKEKQRQKQPPA